MTRDDVQHPVAIAAEHSYKEEIGLTEGRFRRSDLVSSSGHPIQIPDNHRDTF